MKAENIIAMDIDSDDDVATMLRAFAYIADEGNTLITKPNDPLSREEFVDVAITLIEENWHPLLGDINDNTESEANAKAVAFAMFCMWAIAGDCIAEKLNAQRQPIS